MGEAVLYGVVASAALVLGAFVGSRWKLSDEVTALLLAFGGGALISSLSFELFGDAFEKGGFAPSAAGMVAGAVTFVAIDKRVERRSTGAGSMGLLVGALLDGVPENLALGTTLAEGSGSVALLVAIFVSNFPEGAGGAKEMGGSRSEVMRVWGAAGLALAVAVPLGFLALDDASDKLLAVVLSFAGGAVLATLFASVIPEAHRDGRGHPYTVLAAVAGFVLSFSLGTL